MDLEGKFASVNTNCFYAPKENVNMKYITGIANSKVFQFVYEQYFGALRMSGGYLQYQAPQLRIIPIKHINFSDPADKQKHDAVVGLVETMLSLHEQKAVADPSERARLEGVIAAADAQLDGLVYGLYELSEEEIKIVEGSVL